MKFAEEDHGSDEVGKASSEEGSGSDEEGNASAVVDRPAAGGNDSGTEGSDAPTCVDGAGSLEGSVGSDQGGKATSSTDSCACAVKISEKNIAAKSTGVLPAIRRAISAVVVAAERAEKGAER